MFAIKNIAMTSLGQLATLFFLMLLTSFPAAADYSQLSWSLSIARNPQTNVITITGTVSNSGPALSNSRFFVYPIQSTSGATVDVPAGGASSIGSSQTVSVTVPAAFPAGGTIYLCVRDGTWNPQCPMAGGVTEDKDASSSPAMTAPPASSVFWAVRARVKSGANANPLNVPAEGINLAALAANTATTSAWLFGCTEQQLGGGDPPLCRVTFTLADGTTRDLPSNPLMNAEFPLFFRGADVNGNLRVCAGSPWTLPQGCKPVWNDGFALAINSIKVSAGTTAFLIVPVIRNVPTPPPSSSTLTVTSRVVNAISSGGTLPPITFDVTRQNPSLPPTSALACVVNSQPANFNYSCAPSGGDLRSANVFSAECRCTPAQPAIAPTVTASTTYPLSVTATADGAIPGPLNTAVATLTVQPAAGNRGCTDDTSMPIIRVIDFASTPSFQRELYPFTTQGDGIVDPPPVGAIKLIVPPGGGQWRDGTLQISPGRGPSASDGVISRCRGQFGPGGREKVMNLAGYWGPESQNPTTFFALWIVEPTIPLGVYTAGLYGFGRTAPDGWLSDGIYYVNLRQTSCIGNGSGICYRELVGTGVP